MEWLSKLLENVPDDPFYQPRKPLWLPREMSHRAGFAATSFTPPAETADGIAYQSILRQITRTAVSANTC